MRERIKAVWEYVQGLLDIDGDIYMGLFTMAVVWKMLHHGMSAADAAAYGSAIGAFAYSNKGPKNS